jgi:hypothetical protein
MAKEIVVDVLPGGSVKIDAVGYTGSACKAATAAIEQALGLVGTSKPKPELHQVQRQKVGA